MIKPSVERTKIKANKLDALKRTREAMKTLNRARNVRMTVPVLNVTCRHRMPMGDETSGEESENEEENSADVTERSDDDED